MVTTLRRLSRLMGVGAVFATALADYAVCGWWRPAAQRTRYQARWLHRYARVTMRVLQIHIEVIGSVEAVPLAVYNHLSYLDIVVIAAVSPILFVAKSEVSGWPLFGWLARCAGTVFIQRRQRSSVWAVSRHIQTMIGHGITMVVFPEGTSSDGQEVLPFYSSLLAPAVEGNWPVQPGHLSYAAPEADPRHQVCWWGDMTLLPHLWQLVGLTGIQATVRLGEPIQETDRKQLARLLHDAVINLAQAPQLERWGPVPPVWTREPVAV